MFFSNFNKKIQNIMKDEEFKKEVAEQQKNTVVNNEKVINNAEVEQLDNNSTDYPNNNYEQDYNSEALSNAQRTTILDNLVQEDKDFSEASFKAKVDNIFIQLYTAVMKQDLQRVKHFLSDEVYEKYEQKINQLKERNELQIYDELNVSDTNITNVEETNEEFKLYVNLLTKYLDYTIAKDTRAFLHGNKDVRVERRINLVFEKTKRAKELKSARTCQSCGANVDINKTGVCPYCGSIFKLKEYDWILTQIND